MHDLLMELSLGQRQGAFLESKMLALDNGLFSYS